MDNKVFDKIEAWFKSVLEPPLKTIILTEAHTYLVANENVGEKELDEFLTSKVDVLLSSLIAILPAYLKPEAIITEPFVTNLIKSLIPTIVAELYADSLKTT